MCQPKTRTDRGSEKNIRREIFTAIVTAQIHHTFRVTYVRNHSTGMQNSTSSISLLLGGCRGKCTYLYDIGADGRSTAHTYGRSMDTGVQIYRYGLFTYFFALAVLTYTYIRISFVIDVNISLRMVFSVLNTYVRMYVQVQFVNSFIPHTISTGC